MRWCLRTEVAARCSQAPKQHSSTPLCLRTSVAREPYSIHATPFGMRLFFRGCEMALPMRGQANCLRFRSGDDKQAPPHLMGLAGRRPFGGSEILNARIVIRPWAGPGADEQPKSTINYPIGPGGPCRPQNRCTPQARIYSEDGMANRAFRPPPAPFTVVYTHPKAALNQGWAPCRRHDAHP